MAKRKETCDHCKETVDADTLIACPGCEDMCCDDCICGVGVDCFQCEEGGDVEEDEDDDGAVIVLDDADDFLEDDSDIEED